MSGDGAGAYFPPRTDDGDIVDDDGNGYPNVDGEGFPVICAGCASVFDGAVRREQIIDAPAILYGVGAVHYVCDETCGRIAVVLDEPHVNGTCGCDVAHYSAVNPEPEG